MKTKTVKLTPKQQEVVNLMADGFKLEFHIGTGSSYYWATLRKKNREYRIAQNTPGQLEDKGVVEQIKSDWRTRAYQLTELGKSLAARVEKPSTVTWWTFGFDWEDKPTSQEFVRETDAYLIRANGRKESKAGGCGNWYPTKAECIEAKRERLEKNAARARIELQDEEEKLEKFNKLYPKGGAA